MQSPGVQIAITEMTCRQRSFAGRLFILVQTPPHTLRHDNRHEQQLADRDPHGNYGRLCIAEHKNAVG